MDVYVYGAHNYIFLLGITGLGVFVSVLLLRTLKHKIIAKRTNRPPDTVILHQTGRGPFAPSISPFAVKLETYLRISKIPYQNVHDKVFGPKGKVPWIEYNNKVIPDTQFIIDFLNKERNVDLNKHLTLDQEPLAKALQRMIDEHTYWLMVVIRWKYDEKMTVMKTLKWNWLKIKLVAYLANRQTYQQGLGRHKKEEIKTILEKDFRTISEFLGDKKYLFGDQPCEVDCSLFGQLSQFKYHLPVKDVQDLFNQYPNLERYCEQMKSSFWSDWDECVLCPEKKTGIGNDTCSKQKNRT